MLLRPSKTPPQCPKVLRCLERSIAPISNHAMQPLLSAAASVVSGRGSMESLVSKFVAASGVEPRVAHSRAEHVIAAYQAQAELHTSRTAQASQRRTCRPSTSQPTPTQGNSKRP